MKLKSLILAVAVALTFTGCPGGGAKTKTAAAPKTGATTKTGDDAAKTGDDAAKTGDAAKTEAAKTE